MSQFLTSVLYFENHIVCLAQAGGGGDFGGSSGGGGGDFSFGGGGDSDGDLSWVFALIEFTFHYPHIGVPIWIGIGYLLYASSAAQADRRITRTIRRGTKQQQSDVLSEAINRIRTTDAQFQEAEFLKRVTQAFRTIQGAWSVQDLRRCRAFISDGVHERFDLYIQMQEAEGYRNRVENVSVTESSIVSAVSESHFDTIHVRVTASAEICDEKLTVPSVESGKTASPRKKFTEVWSFSRRRGVKTNSQVSLLDGQCPHCGGSVEIVDKAQCPNCQSIVNSGLHDWVLTEITQDCEWLVPVPVQEIPGWQALTSRDPGLSPQQLEDRASTIFWRCLMALYFQDRTLAKPVLFQSLQSVPAPWTFAEDGFWKRPAMGSVQVLRCDLAAAEDEFDQVVILVRWSATKATGDRRKPTLSGQQTVYAHALTLKRRPGVLTNIETTFSSFSCRACGAPIDVGSSEACRFCHNSLNDGTYDWVVESVQRHNPFEKIERRAQRLAEPTPGTAADEATGFRGLQATELLTAVAGVLMADGQLTDSEHEFLSQLAEHQKVSPTQLQECFAAAGSIDGNFALPDNQPQLKLFLNELLRAALADGNVSRSERDMLLRITQPLGWSVTDLKQGIGRVRRDLFHEAKRSLKQSEKTRSRPSGPTT